MQNNRSKLIRLVFSAMFLSFAIVLPFLTGQIPTVGRMLCPMHIPVLLCGFFCGPSYGAAVGFIAPLLRSLLFAMPPMFPDGVAMAFELCTYGLLAGILYTGLPKKPAYVYLSLVGAMLGGRLVWGAVRVLLFGLGNVPFGWAAFVSGAFVDAIPGIIIHIILIPIIVLTLQKPYVRLLNVGSY